MIGNKTDKEIVAWANDMVGDKHAPIKDMNDKTLGTGLFLIKLCESIEPRAVNPDLVTPGETEEDAKMNARLVISIARKFGAVIFCVWENIV